MAKKDRNQAVVFSTEPIEQTLTENGEPLFESEAYGSPQPEAGSDVTVMKPVGIGGPVPIVAPKHNTIQLQPIVVPLAVVPYMTQDSNVLRTDGRQQGGYVPDDEYAESTQFEAVSRERTKKKRHGLLPRIFALISLVLAAVALVPFLVSATLADGDMFNIIDIIENWIANGFSWSPATSLLYIAVAFLAAVQAVLALVCAIIGKYPKPITPIFSFIDMSCMIGILISQIVAKTFDATKQTSFMIVLVASILGFLTSVVFSVILNHREDRVEQDKRRRSEI